LEVGASPDLAGWMGEVEMPATATRTAPTVSGNIGRVAVRDLQAALFNTTSLVRKLLPAH
jgi:hypothetical protein